MLHAEKITACALLELGHVKEPGRAPQWVPEKGRGPRLVSCTAGSSLQADHEIAAVLGGSVDGVCQSDIAEILGEHVHHHNPGPFLKGCWDPAIGHPNPWRSPQFSVAGERAGLDRKAPVLPKHQQLGPHHLLPFVISTCNLKHPPASQSRASAASHPLKPLQFLSPRNLAAFPGPSITAETSCSSLPLL